MYLTNTDDSLRLAAGPGKSRRRPRVLAVSSGGGHWVQLLRLRPALAGCDVAYVTVRRGYRSDVGSSRFYTVSDATRWNRCRLFLMAIQVAYIILVERPDVVISTGAAPGYFALWVGHLLRARTVWIDSIANVEHMSLSGTKVGRVADLWLTQWPHLAREEGPKFEGAVL